VERETWLEVVVKAGGAFITGTDTGVGKTVVTAVMGRRLQQLGVKVGAYKPVSTGGPRSEDGVSIKTALRLREPLYRVAPVHFVPPVAPWVASEITRRRIPWAKIRAGYRWWKKHYPVVLVEGVGGVMVPLDQNTYVADLIREFSLPTVIVARAGLGTINHTVLTVEALRRRHIKILGVILNGAKGQDLSERTNPKVIEACAGIPVLSAIPYQKSFSPAHV